MRLEKREMVVMEADDVGGAWGGVYEGEEG